MKTILILFAFGLQTFSQVKTTKVAYVSFYSELEEVLAENFSGSSQLNTETGQLIFSFPIQSFFFENATMQKHFNEADVMDSKQYPRSKFVGSITNNDKIDYQKNGEYSLQVEGNLTIKSTTNFIKTKATLKIENGKLSANASFKIDRFKYGIEGKEGAISEILDLTVKAIYE